MYLFATRKHPLRGCILAPPEGLHARSYPGFDKRSSALPSLRQLFAGLKLNIGLFWPLSAEKAHWPQRPNTNRLYHALMHVARLRLA